MLLNSVILNRVFQCLNSPLVKSWGPEKFNFFRSGSYFYLKQELTKRFL